MGLLFQAQPEVLFEGTVAEGAPFKVQAAITDPSGFADFDDAPFELEFRCTTMSTHLVCHCVLYFVSVSWENLKSDKIMITWSG